MRDRRRAMTKVMFLFKNGTQITTDTPYTVEEFEKLYDASGPVFSFDILEKDAKIGQARGKYERADILGVTVFELNEVNILLPEKKVVTLDQHRGG